MGKGQEPDEIHEKNRGTHEEFQFFLKRKEQWAKTRSLGCYKGKRG